MTTRFVAEAHAVEELTDLGTFVVALSELPDGGGTALQLQRALAFDAGDRATGMDTYCLCAGSGATHYGGVVAWRLTGALLELRLTAEAADALGMDEVVRIEARPPAGLPSDLRAGLRRVLAEVPEGVGSVAGGAGGVPTHRSPG